MFISLLIIIGLIGLDQLTKYLVVAYVAPVGAVPFIPHVVELRYVLNEGAAFSMLSGKQEILIVFTSIALIALLYYVLFRKPSNKIEYIALLLIISGGIGNLIDRIFNGVQLFKGGVVDFFNLLFMDFAVFNVADCFVVIGVGLWSIYLICTEIKDQKAKKQQTLANNEDEHD